MKLRTESNVHYRVTHWAGWDVGAGAAAAAGAAFSPGPCIW